jgi:capsid protein
MWSTKLVDGEAIALIHESQLVDHEIQLDLWPIESEQVGNPGAMADTDEIYDGVRHVKGRPLEYYIFDQHPNAYGYSPISAAFAGQWYDQTRIVHCFRQYRIGQLRGATELGPALELAAILRRYTLATLNAAEAAASISLWLETDGSPEEGPQEYTDGAFTSFPVTRNLVITAPYGWHAKQIQSQHPDQLYETFVRCIVTQMGRSLGLPAALSYGDSSTYNMASGRLDFQTYIRSIDTERAQSLEPSCLEKIFLVWIRYYLSQRSGISPYSIDSAFIRTNYPHRWAYRPINHSDPEKQSAADVQEWEVGLLTDDEFLYRRGIDPETHYKSLARQNERRRALGMRMPGEVPGLEKQEPGSDGGRGRSEETERTGT